LEVVMKPKLCSVLVVLFIAALSATAAHADEPGAVGVEETVSEPVSTSDALSAQLEAEVLRYYSGIGAEPTEEEKGTILMTAAFVAQGISLSSTVVTLLGRSSNLTFFNTVLQMSTIPFAPMGVQGFAFRYGRSWEERLRWTGIGLLEAAAFSVGMGALTVATVFVSDYGSIGAIPAAISYFSASIAFGIAGGVCVGVAKAQERRQGKSQSRVSPARGSHRGFVMPTIAPRSDGLSLGLAGVF
jgi:hypothetical protein